MKYGNPTTRSALTQNQEKLRSYDRASLGMGAPTDGIKKSVPKVRHHKATGQAVVTLTDARTGRRVDRYCGAHGSTKAAKRYAEIVEQWEQQGRTLPGKPQRTPKPEAGQESVAQLALDYSAARAGEVCMMRPKDLDVSGKVWM